MNIEIRRPKIDDVEELKALFRDTVNEVFDREGIDEPELKKDEINEKQAFLMEDLNSEGKDRYFLIAVVGNEIAGTIAIGPSNSLIHEAVGEKLDEVLEIGTVYVHPNHQKKGIGMKLMNAMYITLMSRGIYEFCLDSGYKSAQKIWTRKIGEPEYIDKDKWGEGNHHMVWHKSLKDIEINL